METIFLMEHRFETSVVLPLPLELLEGQLQMEILYVPSRQVAERGKKA